jgi:tetratricopeptide (TPR) repeat protein
MGYMYSLLSEQRQALKFYKQAISIHQALGDRLGEITTLLNMGSLYRSRRQKKLARSCYCNAQKLVEQIEHPPLMEKVQQCMDSL